MRTGECCEASGQGPTLPRLQRYREQPLGGREGGCWERGRRWWRPGRQRRLPRTGRMCRLLAVLLGLLLALHAASCGLFFCIRIPGVGDFSRDIYDDVRDLYVLAGEACVCGVA